MKHGLRERASVSRQVIRIKAAARSDFIIGLWCFRLLTGDGLLDFLHRKGAFGLVTLMRTAGSGQRVAMKTVDRFRLTTAALRAPQDCHPKQRQLHTHFLLTVLSQPRLFQPSPFF